MREATAQLSATSTTPRLDAELLLAHVLGWPRARLLAERDDQPTAAQTAACAALIARRVALEPVAYLVGHKAFYGLDLEVTPATLVPRPETELLVELALDEARRYEAAVSGQRSAAIIADIGTGSGAIAIALASHLPTATIYATDVSAAALEVARRNVVRHGLSERVRLYHGDLLAPLPGPVDLLVSNPPYTILAEVEPNVYAHEPHLALDGGPDGAAVYRRLVANLADYVRPGGAVLLEIGAWQGALVASLLRALFPTATVSVHQDLAGRDRVVRIVDCRF
ncbi:MAG: peptide chain release factor N(5)-glutamine methyltransferase [Chloroflexales bacterium]